MASRTDKATRVLSLFCAGFLGCVGIWCIGIGVMFVVSGSSVWVLGLSFLVWAPKGKVFIEGYERHCKVALGI
jgi:hypothetical protein